MRKTLRVSPSLPPSKPDPSKSKHLLFRWEKPENNYEGKKEFGLSWVFCVLLNPPGCFSISTKKAAFLWIIISAASQGDNNNTKDQMGWMAVLDCYIGCFTSWTINVFWISKEIYLMFFFLNKALRSGRRCFLCLCSALLSSICIWHLSLSIPAWPSASNHPSPYSLQLPAACSTM